MPSRGAKRNREDFLRKKRRNYAIVQAEFEARGGKCCKCPYEGVALHWHHRDPDAKIENISHMASGGKDANRLRAELEKCDLICANCHAEITYTKRGS